MGGTQEGPAGSVAMPSYSEVFRTRGYLPIFLTAALSTWGDYLARVVVAAFVLDQTGSPFAAAATFAVSLLPSIFGRSLLAPIADRVPYKYVLIVAHLLRAVLVGALILAVSTFSTDVASPERSVVDLWPLFVLLFLLELVGGPVITSGQILMTDLFSDRRLYARALTLGTLSEQVNQAIGLALGGFVVAWVGAVRGLWFDLATFLLSALVINVVIKAQAVRGTPSAGIVGFFRDIGDGATYLFRNPVLVSLLALSLCSVWAIAAPEAVALAYARGQSGGVARLGGLLMAAPILGAVAGLVVVGRWQPERQNSRIIVLALLMPLPLIGTVFAPPVPITWLLWFVCGMLQAFMLPLQSTFSLVVPAEMRGRVFGLGGALSVAASGVAFLVAGYLAERTSPAAAVAICAAASLLAIVTLAVRWPRAALRKAVDAAYNS